MKPTKIIKLIRCIVLSSFLLFCVCPVIGDDAPYPPSPVIESVEWAPVPEIIRLATGGDNWPMTWADDDHLYTAYGDGFGFAPFIKGKLSLGFAKVQGDPPSVQGINVRSESGEQIGDGNRGKKASGMLMIDGVLYMWTRNAGNSQLAWSKDYGKTWTWSDWTFTTSFGCPTFLNFGKNYEGARDEYVYIYSQDHDSAYEAADQMVMARVAKDKILERDTYEFIKEIGSDGKPVWTQNVDERGAVFSHPQRCYRSGITYNPALKRYLWCQILPGEGPRFAGGFGIYDAPDPWGPWTTVYFVENWDVGPGETSSIPTKWMSDDGRSAHLVFSGDDNFSVRKVTFNLREKVFPEKEWIESSPETQGVDSERLQGAIDYLKENSGKDGVGELVIVRNGYLIWKGDNIDKVHGVWSLTKSFTSTVLGLLIDEGKAELDTPAQQHVPEMAKDYPHLTLKHFATMTSGYRAENDEPKGSYLHGPSSTPFLPGKPLFTPPGSKYAYWDSAMNQFANVLTRIADEPIEDYFKRKVADPIGMNREKWDWKDFGEIDGIVVNGGAGNNSNHMHICARELARFGMLFLNQGHWKDRELIDADWVKKVHEVHVPSSMPLGHAESGIDGRGVYGLNWWVNGKNAEGKRNWPNAPQGTYSASGYNNNDMFIIPEWNMVIVRLGLDQNDKLITDEVYDTFLMKVGKAIKN